MSEKKKGWPELGIITKNPIKDKDGNVVKKAGKVQYRLGFKLADDITVLRAGEPVALNEYRSGILTSPVDEVEKLIDLGYIEEDKAEERRDKAKEVHTWLRYKVQLPPPRD